MKAVEENKIQEEIGDDYEKTINVIWLSKRPGAKKEGLIRGSHKHHMGFNGGAHQCCKKKFWLKT
jgi:hypothetical protein